MPKVSGGKPSATRAVAPAREVSETLSNEARRSSSKRPSDGSAPQSGDPTRKHKKVKVLLRRHKSRRDEGGSQSHSRGKEPAGLVEELKASKESVEEIVALVSHRPKSMKNLCETLVRKDDEGYYALYMSDLALQDPDKEMRARRSGSRLIMFMGYRITNLQQEIDALKSGGGPEAVVAAEERATELEKELETIKHERDEALQQLETSVKELNEARGDLSEARRELKEARVKVYRTNDDLLKSVKELESVQVELSRRAIDDYKGSTGFKEDLKRMGRVSYEYGYYVALARFHAFI
ncbi:hypothetical protein B296_00037318 [Ensete ventricosum]|uniref:Uncharacterized protein n=1 Tax=Ensete ventricosum TaxID=4639 RepID=A0A426ZZX0_ENSVE|nr:hypothetical protein B296_00037318 [Ensete ventricosum]